MIDTKQKIIDAAESAFSEHGFEGTSLRQVIAAAGVNLAAIHYHFHNKEGLLEAVLFRRIEPVNARRLALLDAGGAEPTLEQVLSAFVLPTLEVRDAHPNFVRLMGRLHSEGDHLPRIIGAHFAPFVMRFQLAIQKACPELPPGELMWKIHFAIGAMAHAMRGAAHVATPPLASAEMAQRLIQFLCAGFRSKWEGMQ